MKQKRFDAASLSDRISRSVAPVANRWLRDCVDRADTACDCSRADDSSTLPRRTFFKLDNFGIEHCGHLESRDSYDLGQASKWEADTLLAVRRSDRLFARSDQKLRNCDPSIALLR
jgi:hypothetical protein